MSAATQPALMPANDAYNVLVSQVHAPVFFNKLASDYGIVPQTEQEANELILAARDLRAANSTVQTKQAAVQSNFYAQGRADLQHALKQAGFQPQQSPPNDQIYAQAAADACKHPLLKQAALVWTNALAEAMQQNQ